MHQIGKPENDQQPITLFGRRHGVMKRIVDALLPVAILAGFGGVLWLLYIFIMNAGTW